MIRVKLWHIIIYPRRDSIWNYWLSKFITRHLPLVYSLYLHQVVAVINKLKNMKYLYLKILSYYERHFYLVLAVWFALRTIQSILLTFD